MQRSIKTVTSLALCLTLLTLAAAKDEYLLESMKSCEEKKDFFDCTKVRVLKYVSGYTIPIDDKRNTSFPKLVRINDGLDGNDSGNYSSARFFTEDSEPVKFLKFIQRKANSFLTQQGLSIPIPDGAKFFDADTGEELAEVGRKKKFSKKANMMIPILILFKVFKVKVLVALALAGIFFIKKVILVGALVLPSLLHSLKTACKHHFIPHHHSDDHHESYIHGLSGAGDYSGYYGGDHTGKGGWGERIYGHKHQQ